MSFLEKTTRFLCNNHLIPQWVIPTMFRNCWSGTDNGQKMGEKNEKFSEGLPFLLCIPTTLGFKISHQLVPNLIYFLSFSCFGNYLKNRWSFYVLERAANAFTSSLKKGFTAIEAFLKSKRGIKNESADQTDQTIWNQNQSSFWITR